MALQSVSVQAERLKQDFKKCWSYFELIYDIVIVGLLCCETVHYNFKVTFGIFKLEIGYTFQETLPRLKTKRTELLFRSCVDFRFFWVFKKTYFLSLDLVLACERRISIVDNMCSTTILDAFTPPQ